MNRFTTLTISTVMGFSLMGILFLNTNALAGVDYAKSRPQAQRAYTGTGVSSGDESQAVANKHLRREMGGTTFTSTPVEVRGALPNKHLLSR